MEILQQVRSLSDSSMTSSHYMCRHTPSTYLSDGKRDTELVYRDTYVPHTLITYQKALSNRVAIESRRCGTIMNPDKSGNFLCKGALLLKHSLVYMKILYLQCFCTKYELVVKKKTEKANPHYRRLQEQGHTHLQNYSI